MDETKETETDLFVIGETLKNKLKELNPNYELREIRLLTNDDKFKQGLTVFLF